MNTDTNDIIVDIHNVTRKFDKKNALDDISLSVPKGVVFGLIGENGAGKTTLIKHILGLYKAQQGSVRVFGKDPVADPVGVLSRIGYLSEESDLPGWMTIRELILYTEAFYKTWDMDYCEHLRKSFELDTNDVVDKLSKGQRARAGLLTALAYRPDLLLLDEPSSGLDPIVRRDIMGAIVRTIADEGRTVIFSSHLLNEVERVSDYVAMIKSGKIVLCDTIDNIKENHTRVTLRFPEALNQAPSIENVITWDGNGKEWTAIYYGDIEEFQAKAGKLKAEIVNRAIPTLDDIFVARVGAKVTTII